jgi:hypothetical protein
MQRRVFIKLSAFTAAVLAVPFAPGCTPYKTNAESQPIFFSHLVNAKTIAEAGKAYLAIHPEDKNIENLKVWLLRNVSSSDSDAISTTLSARTTNDFVAGKTVTVSGWVLAVTEARQCALFYLLQS